MADHFRDILNQVAAGTLSPDVGASRLYDIAAQPLGFATLDHDRARRCGTPEVIYAPGKTPEQIVIIAEKLIERSGYALATRCGADHVTALSERHENTIASYRGGTVIVGTPPPLSGTPIPIVTAGTSDEPIAEEAELTCRAMGQAVNRINDVGVAGLARLVRRVPELSPTGAIICVAGMEGALPSVLGGLVDVPIIAVPTSVGYGAAFGGIAALLGMLTSCAAGVTLVNIDNGFGAAYTATLIQRQFDSTR